MDSNQPAICPRDTQLGQAAIQFDIGFYDAILAGESIEFAYKLGCNAIQIEGIPEHLTPVLKQCLSCEQKSREQN